MRLIHGEAEFRDLVLDHAAELPPQQRTIADYLLENLRTIPFLSVPELASRTGASEATVVRFAQRIGYAGFSELKMDLVELLQDRLANGTRGDAEQPARGEVLDAVAGLEISNIQRTVGGIDREAFGAVAEAVYGAAQTWTFGMGVSAHLARLAAYGLVQIGVRAGALSTGFSSPREQLVTLRPGDLVLALSFPPYSRQTLDVLRESSARGATTVTVTDRLTSPAVSLADHALAVKSDNTMFTNAVAAVTVLFNALATEIATRHRDDALEAFSSINRILTSEDDVLPSRR